MGGRGAKSDKTVGRLFKVKSFDELKKKPEKEPQKYKTKTGKQVQNDFIKDVKKQIKVDLNVARDKHFDDRNGFNIDRRKLSKNDWYELNSYISKQNKNYKNFKVSIEPNGTYRYYIRIKRP